MKGIVGVCGRALMWTYIAGGTLGRRGKTPLSRVFAG